MALGKGLVRTGDPLEQSKVEGGGFGRQRTGLRPHMWH